MAKKKPAAPKRERGKPQAVRNILEGVPGLVPFNLDEVREMENRRADTNGHPVLARQTRDLSVPLSSDDLQRVGRELGEVFGAKVNELAQQAKLKADMKSRLAKIEADFVQLATTLKTGSETREVEVEVRADYEAKVARAYRVDTGDLLDSRPLNPLELQLTLEPEVAAVVEGAMAESGEA